MFTPQQNVRGYGLFGRSAFSIYGLLAATRRDWSRHPFWRQPEWPFPSHLGQRPTQESTWVRPTRCAGVYFDIR